MHSDESMVIITNNFQVLFFIKNPINVNSLMLKFDKKSHFL